MVFMFHAFEDVRTGSRKGLVGEDKTAERALEGIVLKRKKGNAFFFSAFRAENIPSLWQILEKRRRSHSQGGSGEINEMFNPFRCTELKFRRECPDFDPRVVAALELLLFASEFVDKMDLLVRVGNLEILSRPAGMVVKIKIGACFDRFSDFFRNIRGFRCFPVNGGNDFQFRQRLFRFPVKRTGSEQDHHGGKNSSQTHQQILSACL